MQEEEISLIELVYVLLAKWHILVIATIAAAVLACAGTMALIAPKYQSNGKLYVNSEGQRSVQNDVVNYNTVLTNQKLANTYIEILQSDSFLSTVSDDIGNKYTYSQIASMLTMTSVNDTEVLQISVQCHNPYDAYRITNSIVKNSSDEIERVIDGGTVRIIDTASMPEKPISPNLHKNTAVGALLGFAMCAAVLFVIALLDTRVKAGDDLQNKYSVPILGEIPWILFDQ